MTTLTKEDIEKITAELALPWGYVSLRCDGFDVTVAVVRTGTLKYGLTVYIDGFQKGKHILEDCEERRRFLRPATRYLYSPKDRQKIIKECGKRMAKRIGVDKSFTIHSHGWLSARTMLRHFLTNNASVELIGVGASAARNALPRVEAQSHA